MSEHRSKSRTVARNVAQAVIAALLLLLIGVALSVAIAWCCTFFVADMERTETFRHNGWAAGVTEAPGVVAVSAMEDYAKRVRFQNEYSSYESPEGENHLFVHVHKWTALRKLPASRSAFLQELAAGWPYECLTYRLYADEESAVWSGGIVMSNSQQHFPYLGFHRSGALVGRFHFGQVTQPQLENTRILPIKPLPVPLLMNAGIIALAFSVFPVNMYFRRRHRAQKRRRTRKCAKCGYALHTDSNRCSECGASSGWQEPLVTRRVLFWTTGACVGFWVIIGGFGLAFANDAPHHPLHEAVIAGDSDTVRSLLDDGVDVDLLVASDSHPAGATPLFLAAATEHRDVIQTLIDHGADVNHGVSVGTGLCYTPLHIAAALGSIEVLELLLEAGADIDGCPQSIWTPLLSAVDAGRHDAVCWLLLRGALQEDGDRPSALRFAIRQQDVAVMRDLLEHGAVITMHDLAATVMNAEHAWLLPLLIAYGGDVNARYPSDETLLFWVTGQPDAEPIWQCLIDSGIDVHARNTIGETALFYAGSPEYAEFLLRNGIDVNAQSDSGITALMEQSHHPEMVTVLLEHGADPTMQDNDGNTAANITWDSDIQRLIEEAIRNWQAEEE